ncbi:gap junction Cx32.2 protein-like [Alosa sapidissima]|uniref:gap junction Cx32.2 protein-like n=1 Tax=Alosa sapidissima TaxID=34773 RepID=UPI001C090017|nr:gap junction Cx32.2 protein-like [Alosa sapidissima]
MGDWGFLSKLLNKVQSHSTVIGKVWMTVLFVFRIMVLGAGVEKVWGDEQSMMVCDTTRRGCKNVCYNQAFPISHVRFWVMQIIFVSTPTLVYLAHVIHIMHQEEKIREKLRENDETKDLKALKYTNEKGKVFIRGVLFRSYILNLVVRILLELAFMIGQYYLYGFVLQPKLECEAYPCHGTVECFMSRPREKTIFIIFMLVVSCVSLLLNVAEIVYLVCARVKSRRTQGYPQTPAMTNHKTFC